MLLTNLKDWMATAGEQDHAVAGLQISQSKDYYTRPTRRGPGLWVSYRSLSSAVEYLEGRGLIVMCKRGSFIPEIQEGKDSLYKPTARLREMYVASMFDEAGLPGLVRVAQAKEVLKQPIMPLDLITVKGIETSNQHSKRRFLRSLNGTKLEHVWTVEGLTLRGLVLHFEDYGRITADECKVVIDQNTLTYRRIYKIVDLTEGGRFYTHRQNLRSVCRPFLRIDGERLVELDYSVHHARIAYAMAGVEQPAGDLYALADDKAENERMRPLIKAIMLAIFNLSPDKRDSLTGAINRDLVGRRRSFANGNEFRVSVGWTHWSYLLVSSSHARRRM